MKPVPPESAGASALSLIRQSSSAWQMKPESSAESRGGSGTVYGVTEFEAVDSALSPPSKRLRAWTVKR